MAEQEDNETHHDFERAGAGEGEARALRFLKRTRSPRRRLRRIDRAVSLLAETRLYRVRAVRPIGLYTLFLLGSDFLAVLSLRDVRRMDPRLRLPGRGKKTAGSRAAGPP